MVIGLDLEDCGNLHHSQTKIEQRENRAGTWYCPIIKSIVQKIIVNIIFHLDT